MKIGGPKGPGLPPVEPPKGSDQGKKVEGPSFSEVLRPESAGKGESVHNSAFADVAQKLKSGEIDGTRATEMIIEAVIQEKLAGMKPALQEQLRQRIRAVLTDDPTLAAKVKRLMADKG